MDRLCIYMIIGFIWIPILVLIFMTVKSKVFNKEKEIYPPDPGDKSKK